MSKTVRVNNVYKLTFFKEHLISFQKNFSGFFFNYSLNNFLFRKYTFNIFFSTRVFFHRHWWFTGQQGKGGDHRLFHSTTSTRSTFQHFNLLTVCIWIKIFCWWFRYDMVSNFFNSFYNIIIWPKNIYLLVSILTFSKEF